MHAKEALKWAAWMGITLLLFKFFSDSFGAWFWLGFLLGGLLLAPLIWWLIRVPYMHVISLGMKQNSPEFAHERQNMEVGWTKIPLAMVHKFRQAGASHPTITRTGEIVRIAEEVDIERRFIRSTWLGAYTTLEFWAFADTFIGIRDDLENILDDSNKARLLTNVKAAMKTNAHMKAVNNVVFEGYKLVRRVLPDSKNPKPDKDKEEPSQEVNADG